MKLLVFKISFRNILNIYKILFLLIFLKPDVKSSIENPIKPIKSNLALYQNLPNLLRNLFHRNLFRNPTEPDLALHQSLPKSSPNFFFQNPIEPELALHQSLPRPSPNLFPEFC